MRAVTRTVVTAVLATAVALPGFAHIDQTEPLQSLRQSYFALVGMTFGPMGDMVKGKIDWDSERFAAWSEDLAAVSSFGVERGFAPGSEGGKTRAKTGIWENRDDFDAKLSDFRDAAAKLAEAARSGDADAMKAQFGETGKTCKACHDEYKSKDYL